MAGNNLRFWEKIVLFLRRVMGCNSGGDQGTKPRFRRNPVGGSSRSDNELTPQNHRRRNRHRSMTAGATARGGRTGQGGTKNGEPLPRKPSPQPAEWWVGAVCGFGAGSGRRTGTWTGDCPGECRLRITIKGGDGLSWWSQLTLNLVRELQQVGFGSWVGLCLREQPAE